MSHAKRDPEGHARPWAEQKPGSYRAETQSHMSNEDDKEGFQKRQLSSRQRVHEDVGTMALKPGFFPANQKEMAEKIAAPVVRGQAQSAPYGELTDAEVMLRCGAGDDAAFNYLVEKYRRPMASFMFRMAHNQAVAEELAQEVFLRVYRSRASYQADAKFTTWLYRIATNLAVNHARDTRSERTASTVNLDEPDQETGTTPDVADAKPSVEERLLYEERLAAIRQRVMELPERQRLAVLMHKYQGLDYRQIGEVLKLSESATKSLLFRAYESLRESLKEFV